MRSLWICLVLGLGLGWPAAAETKLPDVESQRWDPPADAISVTDDPAVPYVAYFTPPYRTLAPADLAWSMMATRWRANGQVQLSVGVRILHGGAEPWRIVGWRIADSRFPPRFHTLTDSPATPVGALKPLTACAEGICRTYEAASFPLPIAALAQSGPDTPLEVTILTQAGDTPTIRFPAAIVAELRHALETQRTSLAQP